MKPAATIVLPVHNVERSLRPVLLQILDLSAGAARRLQIAVVDDGSTDGTYETACELARQFPQIHVLRQPYQSGLGPALEMVRRQLGVDQVVAHDGVTAIDLNELAALLAEPAQAASLSAKALAQHAAGDARGSRRFASITRLNARMAEAHRSMGAFRWLRIEEPLAPRRTRPVSLAAGELSPPAGLLGTTSCAPLAESLTP